LRLRNGCRRRSWTRWRSYRSRPDVHSTS
jgi:hypothetical protein